ncbi:B-type lectin plumieribetin-like [Centroberyx affinis]|uniref:B-type lectin plumieribetin-like n=1 Tax=Centroberyx affinis TaxID=166261 RepID=UPI003A5BD624
MSKSFISTDQELRRGDFLLSDNGNYKAIFQDDGNFVVYKWSPIWASNTVSPEPFRILLQQDNNLVMYSRGDKSAWNTGTFSDDHSQRLRLTMTNKGLLVLDKNGQTIWTSETWKK